MKLIKKADIILVTIILLIVILIGLFKNSGEGRIAVIYVDGKEYSRVDLETAKDENIKIGNVHIYADNRKIGITQSDCPCKVCVNSKPISKGGSVIACVPNKIVIEVKNIEKFDGVTG